MTTGATGTVEWTDITQMDNYFLGSGVYTENTRFWIGGTNYLTNFCLRGGIGAYSLSNIRLQLNDKKEFSFNYNGNNKAYWGSDYYELVNSISFTPTLSLYMFAANVNSNPTYLCSIKIYSLQIFNKTTVVRDFAPVLDNNGVAGMYDKVSEQIFYNEGTGKFITSE